MAVVSIKNKLRRGNLLVGNDPFIPTSFESIATVTVGAGGSSSITFSSIPSTFSHLQIRMSPKTIFNTGIDGGATMVLQFNNDTTANYAWHLAGGFSGLGTSKTAGSASSVTFGRIGFICQDTPLTSNYGVTITDILDYANTNKNKTVRSFSGSENNSTSVYNYQYNYGASWRSTSAITSIKIYCPDGGNDFKQHSRFALYGIKSA